MEREDQIGEIANSQDQILENATKKASEQVRKKERVIIKIISPNGFAGVELTGKYLKNKLN